jgi:8-oxo-dGTP diphosphatase
VVGDGPARADLQRRYPHARWLGYRHGEALVAEYAEADVLVFPSRTDTFGLVMLEAMACGTPVAAYPVTGGRVLLIRKRRGHGAGKINGPGGKPDPGESPLNCAVRETEEEVGIVPRGVRLAAVLKFLDLEDDDWLGYVYRADQYQGEPRTTAEAIPAWYAADALPFDEMWDDDRYWLPRLLAGERLEGAFLFRRGRLLAQRLRALGEDESFAEPAA